MKSKGPFRPDKSTPRSGAPAKLKGKGITRGPDGKFQINMIEQASGSGDPPGEEWHDCGTKASGELDDLLKRESLPDVAKPLPEYGPISKATKRGRSDQGEQEAMEADAR